MLVFKIYKKNLVLKVEENIQCTCIIYKFLEISSEYM